MTTGIHCRCGHPQEAHEHYRRGTDCALCGLGECRAFVATITDSSVVAAEPAADPSAEVGGSRTAASSN